eukprot:Nk52_evm23s554 gene=Nk52_evmTU23s554
MGDYQVFERTLQMTLSPVNEERNAAEQALKNFQANADAYLPLLLRAMRTSQMDQVRQMAAIILRRQCFTVVDGSHPSGLWGSASDEVRNMLYTELLSAVGEETKPIVRKKVCDAVSEVGKHLSDVQAQWPSLLPFMFECCKSQNPSCRESALQIFTSLADVFKESLIKYITVIEQILSTSLNDTTNLTVRVQAVKALAAFIVVLEDQQSLQQFSSHTPLVVQVVGQCLSSGDEDYARSVLEVIIEICEHKPKLIRGHMGVLVEAMVQIGSNTEFEDGTRQLALEVLLTLSEKAPAMVRKFPNFTSSTVPVALNLMIDLDDDPGWSHSEDLDDEDNDCNSAVGEQAMDRLSIALAGKVMLPVCFQAVSEMLKRDWKHRHAALMTISAIGEGCQKQMEKDLVKVVLLAIPYLGDEHPRVRYAACNALGQMATDFAPAFQNAFHAQVMPALLAVMDDVNNPRVQAHSAAALVNFCEQATKELLDPYLEGVLLKLFQLLQGGKRIVQEQAITTIATVADIAEDKFIKYYNTFMPMLINILENATDKTHRLLRGKAMECVSLIGLAVGKEKFKQDAESIMKMLANTQVGELDSDDPQISYMLAAWARICKVLGKEFIPYLSIVMPPLLHSAQLRPNFAVIDPDDTQAEEQYDPAEGWEFVTVDDKKIGIRTSVLEEKATACEMLVCYARELKEGFAPYVDQVVKIMAPMLKFYFHDGVRIAAAASLAPLLKSGILGSMGPEYTGNMFKYVMNELVNVIHTEPDTEILSSLLESVHECVDAIGDKCMTPELLNTLSGALNVQLNSSFQRARERLEERSSEDYDEELEENLEEEDMCDEVVLREVADIIHSLFKTHGTDLLPFFESLLPIFAQMVDPRRADPDHQWAVCIFDDLVEFTGPASVQYQAYFCPALLEYCNDKATEVRHAAVYGVGVAAQYGGESYVQMCSEALPRLKLVIEHSDSRNAENVHATENAIAAVGKIIQYLPQAAGPSAESLLQEWVTWLPIVNDKEESVGVYSFFCSLIESSNPAVLGANNSNIPRILSILATIVGTDLVSPPVNQRVFNLIRSIMGSLPEDLKSQCLATLPSEDQGKITAVLSA